jgi:Putative vitamin uptake transporter
LECRRHTGLADAYRRRCDTVLCWKFDRFARNARAKGKRIGRPPRTYLDQDMRRSIYKFLNHIVLWNVFFAIICIPTAGKLIDVMGISLSISIYYFPFVYVFADFMTEVYGYAVARRVLWYCIFAQLLVIRIGKMLATITNPFGPSAQG